VLTGVPGAVSAMAAYNAVVYAAATYGTGSAAKRVSLLIKLVIFG